MNAWRVRELPSCVVREVLHSKYTGKISCPTNVGINSIDIPKDTDKKDYMVTSKGNKLDVFVLVRFM